MPTETKKSPSWWRENWPYAVGLGLSAGAILTGLGVRRVHRDIRIPGFKFEWSPGVRSAKAGRIPGGYKTWAEYDAAGAGYARHAKSKYTDPHTWYADWVRGKAGFEHGHYRKTTEEGRQKATRDWFDEQWKKTTGGRGWQDWVDDFVNRATGRRTYGGAGAGAGARPGSRPGAGRTYTPPPPPGGVSEAEAFSRLGVKPGASRDEVRSAFRRKMYEAHPDRGGSHEQAVRVTEAWDAIKDKYAALVEHTSFKEAMERWTSE